MFVKELDGDAADLKLFVDRHTHESLNCQAKLRGDVARVDMWSRSRICMLHRAFEI